MADALVQIVRDLTPQIQDGRTIRHPWRHAGGEMLELEDEITAVERGDPPGPDGVVGEAIDVVLCMLDIIFLHRPDITDAEITRIAAIKGNKWLVQAQARLVGAKS